MITYLKFIKRLFQKEHTEYVEAQKSSEESLKTDIKEISREPRQGNWIYCEKCHCGHKNKISFHLCPNCGCEGMSKRIKVRREWEDVRYKQTWGENEFHIFTKEENSKIVEWTPSHCEHSQDPQ